MIARRLILGAAMTGSCGLAARAQSGASAGDWPSRPLRMIIPFPPGGSIDVTARIYADQLQQRLGQGIVVENRPGAGGTIGMDAIAKATPDGYTFGMATAGIFSVNEFLYTRLPYDIVRDFQPVSLAYEMPNIMVVSSQHCPARTIQEFITWARAQRQGISYGSPGVGTLAHLAGGLLASRERLDAVHVPFRGASQIIPAMLSGDLTCTIDNLASYVPVIQEGRMRAFAVTSGERWPSLPEIPTMAEAGMPDFVFTAWASFVVPARTPRPVVDRLNAVLKTVAEDAAVRERALQAGTGLTWSTPEGAAQRAEKERPVWREAVRITGARAD